jgi:hypothetical protein
MSSATAQEKPHWGVDPNPYVTETNPRWTAVDEYSLPHLHNSSNPYHAAIEHASKLSR